MALGRSPAGNFHMPDGIWTCDLPTIRGGCSVFICLCIDMLVVVVVVGGPGQPATVSDPAIQFILNCLLLLPLRLCVAVANQVSSCFCLVLDFVTLRLCFVVVVAILSWSLGVTGKGSCTACSPQGERIAWVTGFYYLAAWAATHCLQRIYLHFWRVDAVIQGAYQEGGCCYTKSLSTGWMLLYKELINRVDAVIQGAYQQGMLLYKELMEGGCCYTRSLSTGWMLLYKELMEGGCCYTRSLSTGWMLLYKGGWMLLYKELINRVDAVIQGEGGCCYTRSLSTGWSYTKSLSTGWMLLYKELINRVEGGCCYTRSLSRREGGCCYTRSLSTGWMLLYKELIRRVDAVIQGAYQELINRVDAVIQGAYQEGGCCYTRSLSGEGGCCYTRSLSGEWMLTETLKAQKWNLCPITVHDTVLVLNCDCDWVVMCWYPSFSNCIFNFFAVLF